MSHPNDNSNGRVYSHGFHNSNQHEQVDDFSEPSQPMNYSNGATQKICDEFPMQSSTSSSIERYGHQVSNMSAHTASYQHYNTTLEGSPSLEVANGLLMLTAATQRQHLIDAQKNDEDSGHSRIASVKSRDNYTAMDLGSSGDRSMPSSNKNSIKMGTAPTSNNTSKPFYSGFGDVPSFSSASKPSAGKMVEETANAMKDATENTDVVKLDETNVINDEETNDIDGMSEQQVKREENTRTAPKEASNSILQNTNISQLQLPIETGIEVDVITENVVAVKSEEANDAITVGPVILPEEEEEPSLRGKSEEPQNAKSESNKVSSRNEDVSAAPLKEHAALESNLERNTGDCSVKDGTDERPLESSHDVAKSMPNIPTKEEKEEDIIDDVNVTKGKDSRPPATKLIPTGVVCLRGSLYRYTDGRNKVKGVWATSLDVIMDDPQNTEGHCGAFEYEHQSSLKSHSAALSGKYSGWFELFSVKEKRTVKSSETDVELAFIENREGYYNIEGEGSNSFGKYTISGTLLGSGIITMFRHYVAAPRATSNASREKKNKRRRSVSAKPKKKGKINKMKMHKDSGKRYGIGRDGLICDCCFLEEDKEVGQTPFIQCLYCDLVAHSACYPPLSTVDANGKFLCDVCSVQFHPSIKQEQRTKFSVDDNIPTPKPLAEDIAAKHDGRLHKENIYCQFCGRRDVLGGMKPTDSGSWVHVACLMAADEAYFDDSCCVAVGVPKVIKKKRALQTGLKPKCDECGGDSGMLLRCREDGCKVRLHALCAEILDRLRIVEHKGGRDVLSYKCTEHSYEGLDLCGICRLGHTQNEMLECDRCQQGYHMFCLSPPLTEVPEGDWSCHACLDTKASDDLDNV